VFVELYGTLRIRTGQASVPVHAATIRAAMRALAETRPEIGRLLPPVEQLALTHRFSINGRGVTTDLDTPLVEGDRLILFSASVGG
jgi:molybdopterin converting factor small subunit